MAGAKLEQAKKALAFCVENLNDNDRFEILRFATEVEALFDKLTDASKANRSRAQSFIKDLRPLGGTAIDDALRKALALRPEKGDRPYVIIFLTDGRPTVGNTQEDSIVDNVKKASGGNVRVFCFGIGTDVNTHLLDKITDETRAFSQYVLPEEDIEIKVSAFFTKIKEPVLASPKLTFPDSIRVTKLYPSTVPDIFKGEQLVLAGRYSGKGDGAIQIEGTVNGETKRFAYDVKFTDEANDHEFIPRLWATRRVGYLLDEIRLRGENKELKDEVVELSRKYSIVTPYTAYLITEDEARRGVAQNVRTLQFENEVRLREAKDNYSFFMKDKSGQKAVNSTRSYSQLKAADAPTADIGIGNVEALRGESQMAPALRIYRAQTPAAPAGIAGRPPVPEAAAQQYAEQSRFVAGKTFFQNSSNWVDSEVQKNANAKRVRIQFGSQEYFDLQKNQPKAQVWLAQGRNVQFVLGDSVYEIYE
jgi:Ca-activated chloride channel family protein